MRRSSTRNRASAGAIMACLLALAVPHTASAYVLDSGAALASFPRVELEGEIRKPSRFRMEWIADGAAVLSPDSRYKLRCRKGRKTRTRSNQLSAQVTMISALFAATDWCEITAIFELDRPSELQAQIKAKRRP